VSYLIDNPPRRSQYRRPRREEPSGVIAVHTAENAPDLVAFDGGAEAVARFIRDRSDPGSYHELVDSDSGINLVPYDAEAFHDGTGTNPHSLGLSFATRADVWPLAPQAWRDGAIEQGAQRAFNMARWIRHRTGIVVPARRISAAQARARVPGFVTHAELDPGRRSDPGRAFPFDQFLGRFDELMGGAPAPAPVPEEDNTMYIRDTDTQRVWAVHDETFRWIGADVFTARDNFVRLTTGKPIAVAAMTSEELVEFVDAHGLIELPGPAMPGATRADR
jgi:hypothetical protein